MRKDKEGINKVFKPLSKEKINGNLKKKKQEQNYTK